MASTDTDANAAAAADCIDPAEDSHINVASLEAKWVHWSEDLEETGRLFDGVADDADLHDVPLQTLISGRTGAAPKHRLTLGALRRRLARRRPLEWVVRYSPVYYGWVAAALSVLASMVASPVQPFCTGVIVDGILSDMNISRPAVSALYAAALVVAAPVILLHNATLRLVPRRPLLLLAGLLFCGCAALLAAAQGGAALLVLWTLMQALGPGVLVPAASIALGSWWGVASPAAASTSAASAGAQRARVLVAVEVGSALVGMLLLPALLTAAAGKWESYWRFTYVRD